MNEFKEAQKDLDIVNNLIQLSRDGPNVNWAFFNALEEYRKTEDPSERILIVQTNKLLTLDLKSKGNLIPLDSINVGFGAESVNRKLATTKKTLEPAFRIGVTAFLIHLIQNLFQNAF